MGTLAKMGIFCNYIANVLQYKEKGYIVIRQ